MNTDLARRQMVLQQVRAWDVLSPDVLETLATLKRENFVQPGWRSAAFADAPIPLGHGQSMFAPKLEGRILQELNIKASDSILEIGCGSGFLTACLATLGREVHALDRLEAMVEMTRNNLTAAGIDNVTVEQRDVAQSMPERRYDVVVVGGSIDTATAPFEALLNDGGRLFVVCGRGANASAMRIRKASNERWVRESVFETALPLLHGFEAPARLVF
ncbi:MAG: protein-L-isoaspartate O-methyltransferase [Pseudomonadota bacterium]